MSKMQLNSLIQEYSSLYDLYQSASRQLETKCKDLLAQNNIRALTSSRAKLPASLGRKILSRTKTLGSHDEKLNTLADAVTACDIGDLAGVRIACHFPNDILRVEDMIGQNFDVTRRKVFLNQNYNDDGSTGWSGVQMQLTSGYTAIHFRIILPVAVQEGTRNVRIEIQVASVLMYAWAELQHALDYKACIGKTNVTARERRLMDKLYEGVKKGEVILSSVRDSSDNTAVSRQSLGVVLSMIDSKKPRNRL